MFNSAATCFHFNEAEHCSLTKHVLFKPSYNCHLIDCSQKVHPSIFHSASRVESLLNTELVEAGRFRLRFSDGTQNKSGKVAVWGDYFAKYQLRSKVNSYLIIRIML